MNPLPWPRCSRLTDQRSPSTDFSPMSGLLVLAQDVGPLRGRLTTLRPSHDGLDGRSELKMNSARTSELCPNSASSLPMPSRLNGASKASVGAPVPSACNSAGFVPPTETVQVHAIV
jgi:hypothetical protein